MARKKNVLKIKEEIQLSDQQKQEIFRELDFLVGYISRRYFENVKKTKEMVWKLLESTKIEADNKTFIYDSAELEERDLYCLQELDRQAIYEYYGQHNRLLSHAILIATYSALEHLLAALSRCIIKFSQRGGAKDLYVKDSLEVLATVKLDFDAKLIEKINTLRMVRNILVHANGEYINQCPADVESILNVTDYISADSFGSLDIRPEYLDDSLACVDKIVSSLKAQLDDKILERTL